MACVGYFALGLYLSSDLPNKQYNIIKFDLCKPVYGEFQKNDNLGSTVINSFSYLTNTVKKLVNS